MGPTEWWNILLDNHAANSRCVRVVGRCQVAPLQGVSLLRRTLSGSSAADGHIRPLLARHIRPLREGTLLRCVHPREHNTCIEFHSDAADASNEH